MGFLRYCRWLTTERLDDLFRIADVSRNGYRRAADVNPHGTAAKRLIDQNGRLRLIRLSSSTQVDGPVEFS